MKLFSIVVLCFCSHIKVHRFCDSHKIFHTKLSAEILPTTVQMRRDRTEFGLFTNVQWKLVLLYNFHFVLETCTFKLFIDNDC